jgi:deoxyribonuclease-4
VEAKIDGVMRMAKSKNSSGAGSDQKYERLLGAHTSIAGGFAEAMQRIDRMSFTAAQIFVKNNHQWMGADISKDDLDAYWALRKRLKGVFIFGHTGYLINCASSNDDLWNKSIESLTAEVHRASILGLPFLVLHPGSHGGMGEAWGVDRCAMALDRVFEATKGISVKVALETTAGQGHALGSRFEHLGEIYQRVKMRDRVAFCIDTAHIFSAGYDIGSAKGYAAVINEMEGLLPVDRVKAWHVNDSAVPLGSRKDRHEHLGKGYIGKEGFRALMEDARWKQIPLVLETPKGSDMAEDVKNLDWLCRLI